MVKKQTKICYCHFIANIFLPLLRTCAHYTISVYSRNLPLPGGNFSGDCIELKFLATIVE